MILLVCLRFHEKCHGRNLHESIRDFLCRLSHIKIYKVKIPPTQHEYIFASIFVCSVLLSFGKTNQPQLSQLPSIFGVRVSSLAWETLLWCWCPRPWPPSRRRLNHRQHLEPRCHGGVGGLENFALFFWVLKDPFFVHIWEKSIPKWLAGSFWRNNSYCHQKYSGRSLWNIIDDNLSRCKKPLHFGACGRLKRFVKKFPSWLVGVVIDLYSFGRSHWRRVDRDGRT